jgi:hypothetical protein
MGIYKGKIMKTILSVVAVVAMMVVSTSEAQAAKCRVELQAGNGRVLETFMSRGYDRQDACMEAKRDCRRVKRAGYYRARYQECVALRNQNRRVERSCNAEMTGPRGHRTFGYFTAYATGARGTGVKGEACRKALRKCIRSAERQGRMRAVCTSDNGRSARVRSSNGRHRPQPMPPVRTGRGRGGRGRH